MRLFRPTIPLKTINKEASKVFKGVPLRLVLVVPFVLQIFAAVGLIGYFSLRNGQQAVNDLASQLMNKVGGLVEQHLDKLISIQAAT